jgi:hypothetical protein
MFGRNANTMYLMLARPQVGKAYADLLRKQNIWCRLLIPQTGMLQAAVYCIHDSA